MSDVERDAQTASGNAAGDAGFAAVGGIAGAGALLSAAACCVLPLALASIGVGSAGVAALVPLRWPFTVAAALAVGGGWFFYLRRRRACAAGSTCSTKPTAKSTIGTLSVATAFVVLSVVWVYLESPLLQLLGGA